jgi:hypothetical protein
MTINTSNFGGDNALIRLSPDLLALERRVNSTVMHEEVTLTMVAGVENAILTLTGKHAVSCLELSSLVAESMTVRLVVDTVEIWDATVTVAGTEWSLYNELAEQNILPAFQVTSSLVLYLTTTTDLSVKLDSTAIKIA